MESSTTLICADALCATRHDARLDRVGILLSSLCLVHCLALPIVIALLPSVALLVPPAPWLHAALLTLTLPITGYALYRGWRSHHGLLPARLGVAGIALLVLALAAHEHSALLDGLLTLAGGACVSSAHILNWRSARAPQRA